MPPNRTAPKDLRAGPKPITTIQPSSRAVCALGALLVSSLSAQGCSWIFVDKLPPNHSQLATLDCTSSDLVPSLDGLWAALNLAAAISVAAGESNNHYAGQSINRSTSFAIHLGWTVVSGAASYYGFKHTEACAEAKRQRRYQEDMRLLELQKPWSRD